MDPMHDPSGSPAKRLDLRELQPWNEPDRVTENERLLGGLCYVSQILVPLLLPIIVLLTDEAKKSLFIRYHAVHSLALLVVSFIYGLFALFGFLLMLVITGWLICVAWVLFLPPLVLMVYYGWQAFVGRAPVIPWVTEQLQNHDLL